MKKYLMTGMVAVAFAAAFTSCSNAEDIYSEEEAQKISQQQIQKAYEAAFIATFGQPDKNHQWGFDATWLKAGTRTNDPNSNEWESKGYNVPGAITEDEVAKVLAVFNEKGEKSYTSLVEWDCFFVQQVWKGTAEYTANNGGTVVGGNQMDWLCAYDPSAKDDDHVNNFNNANGSIMLMVSSSTQRFGFKSSTDNGHVFYNFRMEEIDGNYYVGFDFEADGQNPNEQVARDYIYNDWIVKIVPGKGSSNPDPDYDVRIMVEDLSAKAADNGEFSQDSDWDFNDVVFDVKFTSETTCNIRIVCIGGVLPLTVDGREVHALAGKGLEILGAVNIEIPDVSCKKSENGKDIKVMVNKGTEENPLWCEIKANQGQAAAKFACPTTVPFCAERQDIRKKYPTFSKWILNEGDIFWQ